MPLTLSRKPIPMNFGEPQCLGTKVAMPFLLRAVTHLCAPGFFLLMGVGMALFIAARTKEGWDNWRIARFFLIRGVLLIAFQQFLENPAWYMGALDTATGVFTSRGGPIPGGGASAKFYLGVLYGLGSTMFVWGLLFRLPTVAVIALSIAAIGLTQAVVSEFADPQAIYPPFLRMILIPGHTDEWMVFYPTIPWMGITGLGMVLGRLLQGPMLRLPVVYGYRALVCSYFLSSFVCSTVFGNFHTRCAGMDRFFQSDQISTRPELSAADNRHRSAAFAIMDVA